MKQQTQLEKLISSIIQDVLIRLGLPLDNLRGQCYDGAANMSGDQKGVQSRILALQSKALLCSLLCPQSQFVCAVINQI